MTDKYVLDDAGNPIPEPRLMVWAEWMEGRREDRRVARDEVGEVSVSTVFLGLDHASMGGKPQLYETMIFGGPHDEYQERYATRSEALEGHKRALAMITPSP